MRYEAGARSWWKGPHQPTVFIPDDIGTLLPEQRVGRFLVDQPMARVAAAMLVDAVRCLALPRTSKTYREAVRYLFGPPDGEVIPYETACQLTGISCDHLRRRLRRAGHGFSVVAR
jgi:hypothetical protein